jgi:hypothetical protein
MMRKKASDYVIGDRFMEADNHVAGTVVSLMIDPVRKTRAFILVRSDEGEYTLFACQRDAVGQAYLPRNIPEPVLRKFLFDVFTGGNEITHVPGMTREPVRLPEYKVEVPARSTILEERPEKTPVVEPEPSPEPVSSQEPVLSQEPHQEQGLLPEVDFP